MRVLGIDPGFGTIGFGLVHVERGSFQALRFGAITTPPEMEFSQRLMMIYNDMNELLDTLKPDVVAMEELYWGHNVTTGIGVGQARGVLLLACAQHFLPVTGYTPMQVKQAVVGYGKATKKQVMEMTKRLLHLQEAPRPDDAADAVAIALCHARSATSLLEHGVR